MNNYFSKAKNIGIIVSVMLLIAAIITAFVSNEIFQSVDAVGGYRLSYKLDGEVELDEFEKIIGQFKIELGRYKIYKIGDEGKDFELRLEKNIGAEQLNKDISDAFTKQFPNIKIENNEIDVFEISRGKQFILVKAIVILSSVIAISLYWTLRFGIVASMTSLLNVIYTMIIAASTAILLKGIFRLDDNIRSAIMVAVVIAIIYNVMIFSEIKGFIRRKQVQEASFEEMKKSLIEKNYIKNISFGIICMVVFLALGIFSPESIKTLIWPIIAVVMLNLIDQGHMQITTWQWLNSKILKKNKIQKRA